MVLENSKNKKLLEAYRNIPTGNISDAMYKLGMPSGVIIDGPKPLAIEQPRMVGYACTVQQMPRHQSAQEEKLAKHLDVMNGIAHPGDVVVIDVGGRKDVCTGGSMIALRAQFRGISGLVVNGCYRDIAEIIPTKFPIFCTGVIPIKSIPLLETVGINVPVVIGGVQIKPGDLIVGDDTGIVVIPANKAEEVLEVAQKIQKVEEKIVKHIKEGVDYKECRKLAEAEVAAEGNI